MPSFMLAIKNINGTPDSSTVVNSYDDLGLIITDKDVYKIAERDIQTVSIPGRSGDLIIDNGKYKNVEISYECAIASDVDDALIVLSYNLFPLLNKNLYIKDTYNTGFLRFGTIKGGIDISEELRITGKTKISFNCNPYKFLVDGFLPLEFNSSVLSRNTMNLGTFPSSPLIVIPGSTSNFTLTIGSKSYSFSNIPATTIYVDCEKRLITDSSGNVCNSCLSGTEFPTIPTGFVTISTTNPGATSILVIPRWISI